MSDRDKIVEECALIAMARAHRLQASANQLLPTENPTDKRKADILQECSEEARSIASLIRRLKDNR